MDVVDSEECSSGCESGWTLYLEHSFLHQNHMPSHYKSRDHNLSRQNDDEEEDLSMVSDASSGPPHFNEVDEAAYNLEDAENGCFYSASKGSCSMFVKKEGKRQKITQQRFHDSSFLDDTASSPLFTLSVNNFTLTNNQEASSESFMDFSQGFSPTRFGLLQTCLSGNQVQKNKCSGYF